MDYCLPTCTRHIEAQVDHRHESHLSADIRSWARRRCKALPRDVCPRFGLLFPCGIADQLATVVKLEWVDSGKE